MSVFITSHDILNRFTVDANRDNIQCLTTLQWCLLLSINSYYTNQTLWKSLKLEGERTRTNLKVLETLTYSCSNPQDLHILGSQVEELITSFRTKLPKSEGIILRPEARKSVRKRAQQILKKYRPLPLSVRRGRQKSDWHHRNRVGQKASELRKVYTLTPIYKLKT